MSCSTEEQKKYITITNVLLKKLNESGRKRKKIWADQDLEFYDRSMKLWRHVKSIQHTMKESPLSLRDLLES